MKTQYEIQQLKNNWRSDPCWDIERTEGFEEHEEELLKYRLLMEEYWKRAAKNRLAKKAAEMGIPGNFALAAYIERLEIRINKLEGDDSPYLSLVPDEPIPSDADPCARLDPADFDYVPLDGERWEPFDFVVWEPIKMITLINWRSVKHAWEGRAIRIELAMETETEWYGYKANDFYARACSRLVIYDKTEWQRLDQS